MASLGSFQEGGRKEEKEAWGWRLWSESEV